MSRLDIVVYPRDLNGAEAAFNRLGWQTLERFGDGVSPAPSSFISYKPAPKGVLLRSTCICSLTK